MRTDGARAATRARLRRAALYDLRRPDARDPSARPDAWISEYLGVQTNNVAEYTGVVRALDLARARAEEVHLLLDSKLIVEQLAGRWRVKDPKLIRWTAAPAPGRMCPLDGQPRAPGAELGGGRIRQSGNRSGPGRWPKVMVRRPGEVG